VTLWSSDEEPKTAVVYATASRHYRHRGLDPIATLKIEDLMSDLREQVTIIIVTHNMQQAARVSDVTAFMMMGAGRAGELVETNTTRELFNRPQDRRTEDYITGRFG